MDWPESTYLVSTQHRFLYCPIPKVACTSIKAWLAEIVAMEPAEADLHDELAAHASLNRLGERAASRILADGSHFKFVFVRNPWGRLVSAYLDKILGARGPGLPVIKRVQKGRWWQLGSRARYRCRKWLRGSGIDADRSITFREFVEDVAQSPADQRDEHWRPQTDFLGDNRFDFVGRFEALHQDFERVRRKLGIGIPLPHRNGNCYAEDSAAKGCLADCRPRELRELKRFPHYRSFYTPDLADLAASIYRRDIEVFGYG